MALAKEQAAFEERRSAALRLELQPLQGALDLHQQVAQWQERIAAAKKEADSEEDRAAKLRKELQAIQDAFDLHHQLVQWQDRIARAKEEVAAENVQAAKLRKEQRSIEESIEIQSFGFYRPRYGFDASGEYAERLATIREEQKSLIKLGRAIQCDKKWTVDGDAKAVTTGTNGSRNQRDHRAPGTQGPGCEIG